MTKNLMIVAALALASLAAVACTPSETNARPATTTTSAVLLDGKSFAVTSEQLPDGSTFSTDLTFANGILGSSACAKLGYAPSRYTTTREGDVIAFRAEMKSAADVEVWSGRIVGDSVDATVTRSDGARLAWHGRATAASK